MPRTPWSQCGLVWEVQDALRRNKADWEVDRQEQPSAASVIMLMIVLYPFLEIDGFTGRETTNPITFRVRAKYAPQIIGIERTLHRSTGQMTIRLKSEVVGLHFSWQHWINAALGLMKGRVENMWQFYQESQLGTKPDLRFLQIAWNCISMERVAGFQRIDLSV